MASINRKNHKYENAIVVAINLKANTGRSIKEEIIELTALADTAGAYIVDEIIQNREKIDPSTYLGKGKMKTIISQTKELGCSLIIFNDELTPAQNKNIQK